MTAAAVGDARPALCRAPGRQSGGQHFKIATSLTPSDLEPVEEQDKSDKQAAARKPPRVEESKQVVEEYAAGLREIIKKLRRKLK